MTARAAILLLAAGLLCGSSAQAARHPPAGHHRHVVSRRVHSFHLSAEMRDTGHSRANAYASQAPHELRLRPSIDTRFGQGVTASFGYHPGAVGRTLDPNELDGAAAPRLGHDEGTAGASVKIPL